MNQALPHGPGGEEGQVGELSYSVALSVTAVSQQEGQSMKPGHGKLSRDSLKVTCFSSPQVSHMAMPSYLQGKLGILVQWFTQEEEETGYGEQLAIANRELGTRLCLWDSVYSPARKR